MLTRLFTHLTFTLAFALVLLFSIAGTGWGHLYSPLHWLATGESIRPFIYRALVYWMVEAFAVGPVVYFAMLIPAASLLAWVATLHFGLGLTHGQTTIALIGLLPLVVRLNHLYDLPTLALFTLCLACLHRRRFGWFTYCFYLATLNRETSLLLIIILAWQSIADRAARPYVALAIVIFGAVRAIIMHTYRNVPGVVAEWHLPMMIPMMLGEIELLVLYGLLAALVAALALGHLDSKPALWRRAALVTVPTIGAAYWIIGYPFEFRIFLEAYTPVLMLALPTIEMVVRG